MFGFIRKRSVGKIKYFMNKWWFMISSRPLNMEDFLHSHDILNETKLPPLLEFDTMYQYYMNKIDDKSAHSSQIKTQDIVAI